MPAIDTFWRNLKSLHIVFAVSAIAMLAATVWMMADDYADEWRDTQRTFFDIEAARLNEQLSAVQTEEYEEDREDLEERQEKAQEQFEEQEEQLADLRERYDEMQRRVDLGQRAVRNQRAIRDVARANYDLAVRDDESPSELNELMAVFDAEQRKVDELELELEQKEMQFASLRNELQKSESARNQSMAELKEFTSDAERLREERNRLQPDNTLSKFKRKLMELPIVDGFNSHLEIKQLWLPDLQIKLGMTETARFDRCTTCHLAIDRIAEGGVPAFPHGDVESDSVQEWVEKNEYPHPFATHPNPDLYLTAASPHPMSTFGCTICHEGQGSGTSFSNAAHYPDNPHEHAEWEEKYGFATNHFWEYPMYPERFQESSCIKCHHNVTELGVHPEFGASAPKVYRGYQLVSEYGCFGCHEIHGFENGISIGPDLRLEPQTPEEAEKYAADPNLVAGDMRKVGPSLRHIASKTTQEWVEYWTELPKRFRPETRMPQFFHLTNQEDPHAEALQPVELAAIAEYLFAKSEPLDIMQPVEGYEPDAERGRVLFSEKGCLACHSHDEFPESDADFGPNLTNVHAKIRPGQEGFNWLYTWVRDPERHHPRTRMPYLYLEPEGQGDEQTDPAADIAAFLLQKGPQEYEPVTLHNYLGVIPDPNFDEAAASQLGLEEPRGVRIEGIMQHSPATRSQRPMQVETEQGTEQRMVDDPLRLDDVILSIGGRSIESAEQLDELVAEAPAGEPVKLGVWRGGAELEYTVTLDDPLNDIVRLFLSKALTNPEVEDTLATRNYPFNREQIKGDEIELTPEAAGAEASADEWELMKLRYVGRRTISRYGCYGCHDIPGFEEARPIGTTLQDWGRKDTSKLAPEHIEEYLHHHGEADGLSTYERVLRAHKKAEAGGLETGEFRDEEHRDREMSAAYFYESLLHHGRPGFLWQKLRQPRSYDYQKVQTKGYDERLRMPKFPFDEDDIDAIATFVLGLVAEPPSPQYVYRPEGPAYARIEGERLLEKYNCVGCHMVDLPEISYAADLDQIYETQLLPSDIPEAYEMLKQLKPPQEGLTGETVTVERDGEETELPVVSFRGLVRAEPDPEEDPEFQEYSFDLWEVLHVGDKEVLPGDPMLVPKTSLVDIVPARGGDFAQWLVEVLMERATEGNRSLAWQMSPPPLYKEGIKVQTPWLYKFLKEPIRLRHTTVLRMPRFNLSDDDAQKLANYFAAVDGASYPYQDVSQNDRDYLEVMNQAHADVLESGETYLSESWKVLNAPLCIKCHSVGGRQVQISNPATDIRGPDLDHVHERLRPDWLFVWMAKPSWITPYTSMPQVFPHNGTQLPELFEGQATAQTLAVRDALLNYNRLMEAFGKLVYEPETSAEETAPEGGD